MRSTQLSIAVLLAAPAHAQLTAGEVPPGMSALDINLSIALTDPFTSDSVALEFDCDDSFDAWGVLYRNAPEVDAPNFALLRFVDTDIEVCADLNTGWQQRPKYHGFGDPLDCMGSFDWQGSNPIMLGDFGGFVPTGPAQVDSLYIAYRRGAQTGWILLSFDVQGDLNEVSLHVHQLLPLCPGIMSEGEAASTPGLVLFPNPSCGDEMHVQCADALRSIETLDASGRCVARYSGTVRTIPAPALPGAYLVRAVHADGRRTTLRLMRY